MLRNILLLSASLLVGCAPGSSSQSNSHQSLPLRPDIEQFTLPNGLQVYLLPRAQPGMDLRLLVNSGSLQENPAQRGLAHFTEHMAFKGTSHFPGTTSFSALEKQGIKLGSHVNAATSFNATTYRLSLPQADGKQAQLALQILADWASQLSFDPQAFDKERPVIVEEWRLRQGMSFRINNQLEQLRYQGSRYAERDPIGSLEVVRQAPVSEAKNYYQQWYQPQRMALVVIGKFDRQSISQQIQQLFAIPAPQQPAQDDPQWPRFAPQNQMLVRPIFDAEQGSRIIQFALQRDQPAPLNTQAGQYNDLLDSLWLSILNQRLSLMVDNDLLVSGSINNQGSMLDDTRLQQLMIARPKGDDYAGTLTLLFTELQRLASNPVSQSELDQVRQTLLARFSQQAATEQRYDNAYLADQITTALEFKLPLVNKKQQLNLSYQLIKNLSPQDLQHYFAQFLQTASPRLALLGPDTDQAKFNQQALIDLWQQVRQSQPGAFALKAKVVNLNVPTPVAGKVIQSEKLPLKGGEIWTLSNGIQVVVKADNSLKEDVQVVVRVPGGRSLETQQNIGLVNWALRLPEASGYGDYSARNLALIAKQDSLSLAPYNEMLFHGLRGSAPTDHLATLLTLVNLKITAPQFSGQRLEQQKQSFALSLSKQPVERTFLDNITRESYQHGEQMVVDPQGGWREFSAQQLQRTYQQLFAASQDIKVVISGAVNPQTLKPLVERWIGSLPASNERLHWVDQHIVPRQDRMQKTYPQASSDKSMTSIQYAANAQWSQRDQLALQLLDSIVSQRLRFAMREQAGGIYALSFSQLLAKRPTSYYFSRLNFTSAPDRAAEMLAIARHTLAQLQQQGVTAKELDEAKKTWLIENGESQQSAGYWADALAQVASDDQNFAALAAEPTLIGQLSLDEINHVAHQWLGKNEKIFTLTPP